MLSSSPTTQHAQRVLACVVLDADRVTDSVTTGKTAAWAVSEMQRQLKARSGPLFCRPPPSAPYSRPPIRIQQSRTRARAAASRAPQPRALSD